MKWYNKENMARYKDDVSYSPVKDDRENKMIHLLAAWTPKIAITFSRDYAAVGTLDLNDLIGIANLHMIIAINNFDWDREIKVPGIKDGLVKIKDINPKEHAAVIWKYVKKTIMLSIRDEINLYKDGMRVYRAGDPGRKMVKKGKSAEEDFVTQLFPDFFNEEYYEILDEVGTSSWDIEQLSIGLEILMDKVLSFKEKDILKLFYGIDDNKISQQKIANIYRTSISSIQNIKHRAINKLKDFEDNKNIIQNFYNI